ncbi:fibronectin type III domain-containing protein [Sphaerisporangium rubeum]|uniref:Fibronectin type-III domain-containing protein n=1 Tax=Sphaerisporangium rubeum TaxID=321317 RepID=A0A7X0M678_9ACTN|nr:fibronectin type III domain-containing protein [Sphaerisporangium rubeum]MBB6472952.1 hypothetical protein [Sphaerisporangium rubeum]
MTVSSVMATCTAANAGAAPVPQAAHASAWRQPDTQPPTAPTNLTLTESPPDLIILTWGPSTALPIYPPGPGVVAYEIFAATSPFRLIAVVPATQLTFTDRRPPEVTVSYFVKARDAAGKVSAPSNIVTRPGREPVRELVRHEKGGGHRSDGHDELIGGNTLLVHEEGDDRGGGGRGGGYDDLYGGPGEYDESYAGDGGRGGHGGGERGEQGERGEHGHGPKGGVIAGTLPFTGAPVAALAGAGGVLLLAGAAGAVVAVRRRRSAEAR